MKAIFRNFLQTLKRFKFASSLNILGLSVAFAAFMVIMMQVRYDRGFDKFHSQTDRIYRVEFTEDGTAYSAVMSRPMIDQMMQAPQLEKGSLLLDLGDLGMMYGPFLTVERGGEKVGFKESTALIFPDFTDIFDFELIEGDRQALELPDRVLLPQSVAQRLFGSESPLDRPITFLGDCAVVKSVAAVYRDFPENTRINNLIYVVMDRDKMLPGGIDNWGSMGYEFYVTLSPGQDQERLAQDWLDRVAAPLAEWTNTRIKDFRLTPMPDMYYLTDMDFDPAPKGNRTATSVLLGIAILIIAIASINFVNFSTSLAPMRIKSINTRKVLGSPTSALRNALVGEAVGISLIAFGLAVLWVWVLSRTSFTQFLIAPMDLGVNSPVILLSLGVAVAVGLIAGVYPARYTTSFPPALVLKGSFGLSPQGKKLRTALVGFQFVVSIALIIAAVFMQVQNDFVRSMQTGIDNEQIALVELTEGMVNEHQTTLRNGLLANPQVKEVSFGNSIIGGRDAYNTWSFGHTEEGIKIEMPVMQTEWDMPQMLGVELVDGRFFLESERKNGVNTMLVNETAQRRYDLKVGQVLSNGTIVGVIKDFNFSSLRNGIEPMTFMLSDYSWLTWMYVRTSGDPVTAVNHIRNVVASVDPTYPMDVQFYDSVYDTLYQKERKTTGLVTIFSLLAVVISLVGVFGLVMFETQYRRKEIGVRKVMGATIGEILTMFNKRFVWIVTICFVLAAPLAWYGVSEWLRAFAYRTPLYWWVFALSLTVVMLITLTTVTIQSWRAAVTNPVESLRAE